MPRSSSPRRIHCSPCTALSLGFALLIGVPMLAASIDTIGMPGAQPECAGVSLGEPAETAAPVLVDAPAEDILHGLWMRYEGRGEGDPLRFWYFHGDGKGLYRYGKVGLANTHSFDYDIEGAELYLRVRKTGAEHVIDVRLEREGGRTYLTLTNDPYEPGARYYKVESELDAALAQDEQGESERPEPAAAGIGDRIWIDYQRFATGGAEFHMYQLAKTAIDGRGVGWFHRGDFDDWSTESLTYRIDGDQLELFFDLRAEPNVTRFELVDGPQGRELVLDADPRDFWASHRYLDGGKSFGVSALGLAPILAAEK